MHPFRPTPVPNVRHTFFLLSYANYSDGAFCRSNITSWADFPLPVPSTFLIPWVWDAIENTKQNTVDITLVSRSACWFNHSLWQQLNKELPQHSKHLGYGLSSNILVESEEPPDLLLEPLRKYRDGLLREIPNCVYYDNGSLLPVARTKSQRIDRAAAWLRYSTTQIV